MTTSHGLKLDWLSPNKGEHPILLNNQIHLWCVPLKLTHSQESIAIDLLSDIQRDKYHRRSNKLKANYLAGRYFLLNLLAQYTSTEADKIQLSYSRLNKPFLSNKSDNKLQFNFSDTVIDDVCYGVFAFCKEHEIGVDIESKEREIDFKPIAERRFSEPELNYVTLENGEIDHQRCIAIWTRKEAFGKACGKGINFKMNELNLLENNSFELNFHALNKDWRLQQIEIDQNLVCSVVHQHHQVLDIKAFNSLNHIP